MSDEYPEGLRWVSTDRKVWQRTSWGWKYLGVSETGHYLHIFGMTYTDCDHPEDIIFEENNVR